MGFNWTLKKRTHKSRTSNMWGANLTLHASPMLLFHPLSSKLLFFTVVPNHRSFSGLFHCGKTGAGWLRCRPTFSSGCEWRMSFGCFYLCLSFVLFPTSLLDHPAMFPLRCRIRVLRQIQRQDICNGRGCSLVPWEYVELNVEVRIGHVNRTTCSGCFLGQAG